MVVDQLTERSLTEQAGEISGWLSETLAGKAVGSPAAGGAVKQQVLPTHCPSCGAALNSREVTWLDEATAECLYCGGPVRAES
jgi:hypothetical protein